MKKGCKKLCPFFILGGEIWHKVFVRVKKQQSFAKLPCLLGYVAQTSNLFQFQLWKKTKSILNSQSTKSKYNHRAKYKHRKKYSHKMMCNSKIRWRRHD